MVMQCCVNGSEKAILGSSAYQIEKTQWSVFSSKKVKLILRVGSGGTAYYMEVNIRFRLSDALLTDIFFRQVTLSLFIRLVCYQ